MPQSLSAVFIHLVFSTKNRRPFLRPDTLRIEMHAYLGGISKTMDCPPLLVGGTDDHIHALCQLGRSISQADWIKEIKRASSLWVKEHDPALSEFAWQSGYGAFSVSMSNLESVKKYIAGQEHHHRKISFQDEFRALLRKHGMTWDEKYLWE